MDGFNEGDERLLATIGSQVAIAIRTARLLEDARHMVERQRLVSEITTKIRNSNDMGAIIQTTTHELRKALGAGRIRLELGVTDLGDESQNVEKPRRVRSKIKNGI